MNPDLPAAAESASADVDAILDKISARGINSLTARERATLEALLDPMAEAVECWLEEGIERAMNRFNRVERKKDVS